MKKPLARALTAALTLGMLTVNTCAVTPAVSSPELADSPFLPDFPLVAPIPVMPDSPLAPVFPRETPPAPSIDTPFVPDLAIEVSAPGAQVPSTGDEPSVSPSTPAVPAGEAGTYTVQRGDTLSTITINFYGDNAQRYTLKRANAEAFKATNGKLVPGMVLTLPEKLGHAALIPAPVAGEGERLYTVRRGDTLCQIAKAVYGGTGAYQDIFTRNADRLKNPDLIYEDQVIVLPAK